MTHKSIQIRPDWIAGAICELQSVLLVGGRGSVISLGKGCHGNDFCGWACTPLSWSLPATRASRGGIIRDFSLCRGPGGFLLLYFLTRRSAATAPSLHTHTHTHTHTHAFGQLHACWHIRGYAHAQASTLSNTHGIHTLTHSRCEDAQPKDISARRLVERSDSKCFIIRFTTFFSCFGPVDWADRHLGILKSSDELLDRRWHVWARLKRKTFSPKLSGLESFHISKWSAGNIWATSFYVLRKAVVFLARRASRLNWMIYCRYWAATAAFWEFTPCYAILFMRLKLFDG